MSWLYSIVFAGLLFSSSGETVAAGPAVVAGANDSKVLAVKRDETEKFEQTYPISATGRVSVSNVNGSIVLEAWDRNEVRLEALKIADSRETLAEVDIKVDSRPDSLSIKADYGNWNNNRDGNWKNTRKMEVQFRLSVPRTAVLNEIETVNGSVTVSNFTNFTKISAVNGNVSASNLRGAAELSTVNGEVVADFDELANNSRISLNTVNGSVHLVIPSDANATIKADSLNGNIINAFGLPGRKRKYVGRDLHGRIGGGQVPIKLNSVNGQLVIARRADGKTPGPATNLLQLEGGDWGEGGRSAIDTVKLNREIANAVKDSAKHSAMALKEAQKQIEKMDLNELAKLDLKIDTERIQQEVQESLMLQKDALVRLSDIRWQDGATTILKKSNSFAVKGTPKVVIEAKGCAVKVRGWDKQEVQYVLTESAGPRGRTPVTVEETAIANGINIRVPNAERLKARNLPFGDSSNVRLEVFVPKKSNLKITTDGEIRLDGVTGEIELHGDDGAINIREVEGTMKLSVADADVRIVGFKGDLDSQTIDGDVYLEGVFGKLTAKSTDGKVTLTVPEGSNLSFVSNTEIETDGLSLKRSDTNLWQLGSGGTRYNFQFADGNLVVRNAALLNSY